MWTEPWLNPVQELLAILGIKFSPNGARNLRCQVNLAKVTLTPILMVLMRLDGVNNLMTFLFDSNLYNFEMSKANIRSLMNILVAYWAKL